MTTQEKRGSLGAHHTWAPPQEDVNLIPGDSLLKAMSMTSDKYWFRPKVQFFSHKLSLVALSCH